MTLAVDWAVKPQHKQTNEQPRSTHSLSYIEELKIFRGVIIVRFLRLLILSWQI